MIPQYRAVRFTQEPGQKIEAKVSFVVVAGEASLESSIRVEDLILPLRDARQGCPRGGQAIRGNLVEWVILLPAAGHCPLR